MIDTVLLWVYEGASTMGYGCDVPLAPLDGDSTSNSGGEAGGSGPSTESGPRNCLCLDFCRRSVSRSTPACMVWENAEEECVRTRQNQM